MGTHTDICDALVTVLNDGAYTPDFTAVRAYQAVHDLGELADLVVVVMPRAWELESISRKPAAEEDFQVDVAIRQKVADAANATLDPLMDLAEAMVNNIQGYELAGMDPKVICVATTRDQVFQDEHLEELRTFTAVITFTFRMVR